MEVEIFGWDEKMDLVVLKVKVDGLLFFVFFGDFKLLRVGDWVFVIGNLFGLGGIVIVGIVLLFNWNINVGFYDDFI